MSEVQQNNLSLQTDGRTALFRWWHRKTIRLASIEGSLLIRVTVQIGWLDRILIACGRYCIVECRTPASDEAIMVAVEGVQSSFSTVPRNWR